MTPLQTLRHHVTGAIERGEAQPIIEVCGPTKAQIMALLYAWIAQRPGLEFGNYGDVSAYRSEMRSITRDRSEAATMLRAIEQHDSITAEALLYAVTHSYSGRLTIEPGKKPQTWKVEYCTGQYWPTEYRRAVCAIASSALWAWYRDHCLPKDTEHKGEAIRNWARKEFGRAIGKRWFN